MDSNLAVIAQALIDIKDNLADQKTVFSVQIYDLNSSKHRLKNPLSVIITKEDDMYYAASVDLDIFGEGENEMGALSSLKEVVVIYYESLIMSEKELSPLLKSKLKLLKKIILNES